ncbi:phage tail protein [Salmonella enterica]|nr:phage tail protein [Salmonella enterica]
MIGVPIPWPSAIMPSEIFPSMKNMVFLKHNGARFDTGIYTQLAAIYPDGVIPDLRGELIRGWDDGRGVDSGRGILTWQAATTLRTAMLDYDNQDNNGVTGIVGLGFKNEDSIFNADQNDFNMPDGTDPNNYIGAISDNGLNATVTTTITTGISKAITVRPRNVAFNFIVRAA